jgi:predicted deacylase
MSPLLRTTPAILLFLAALVLASIPGCGSTPDLNIPAPWEDNEGPRAEAPIPNLEPIPPGWGRLGLSVRGKQIVVATIGDGPFHIYIVGGIAGDEPEGPAAADRLRTEFFKHLPANVTVRIVRDMNPDGSASHTRGNIRGVDLTRNWPARDHIADRRSGARPASELETTTIAKDLAEFKPDIVAVFRSSARGPMVSMDGPGPLLAAAFGSAARDVDPRWRAIPERRNTERGSFESYIAGELRKPILTIEFQRGRDAATNAAAARAGLLAAAQRALGGSPEPAPGAAPLASTKRP